MVARKRFPRLSAQPLPPSARFSMQFSTYKGVVALLGLSSSVAAAPSKRFDSGSATDAFADLQSQALHALGLGDVALDTLSPQERVSCHLGNAYVRKDWKWLSGQEKTAYINAVLCLQKEPSKADPSFAPGARTRYDDFVAVHLNQTLSIHGTGNFLTWHRYFVWAYENALRQECGYSGSQPYWNWFEGSDFANSPLFDGSATSMSGDGSFVAHNGSLGGDTGSIYIPSGNGGGCLKDGPFKDMTINLGPVSPGMDGMKPGPDGGRGYNPRCLLRDLSAYAVDTLMTLSNLANVTIGSASHSVLAFQNELQGRFGDNFLGMHAAGHFTMGGEGSDFFTSPNDPVFFLHHSMVDHLYFIWQALHPHQARDIAGTITIFNKPPSRDTLKSDILNVGTLAPSITIGDALSTFGGPFCYFYI
ncbi:tyrosinase [Microdochium nivale]|nr:tyrosinase [Microdochium nivale]